MSRPSCTSPHGGGTCCGCRATCSAPHALGIRNLFVCVGDPVTIGDYPQGSNNVDVTATGLLALDRPRSSTAGRDRAGSSIGEPTSFFAGAAVAPAASDLERECRLLKRKVDAGARFLLSQPLYDVGAARAPARDVRARRRRAAPTCRCWPACCRSHSVRHAEFLHNEVPGIVIPARPRPARGRRRRRRRAGVAMAAELATELRAAGAAGVYVMPQFGRYDLAAELVEAARHG